MKKENIKNAKNFDELLDIKYGKIGSKKRDAFEEKAQYFVISEVTKKGILKNDKDSLIVVRSIYNGKYFTNSSSGIGFFLHLTVPCNPTKKSLI